MQCKTKEATKLNVGSDISKKVKYNIYIYNQVNRQFQEFSILREKCIKSPSN